MKVAALIRVSSPQQAEADRASLKSQARVIEACCAALGFKIVERYEGVESATKGDRKILGRLLADAATDRWDAVMVADQTRWSRNPEEAAEAQRILREHRKAFYAGTVRLNWEDPAQKFGQRVGTAAGEYQVGLSRLTSMRSKWTKGDEKLWPYGPMPPGRITVDGGKTWAEDPDAKWTKAKAQKAYHYIAQQGLGLVKASRKLGMEPSGEVLRAYLKKSTRIARYKQQNPDTGEVRVVEIDTGIDLITAAQLAEVEAVWERNRVGGGRHTDWREYPLSQRLRCGCGQMMIGTYKGKRRYVHAPRRGKPKTEDCVGRLDAVEVEEHVFDWLRQSLSDKKSIQRAVVAALDTSHDRRQRSIERQKDWDVEKVKAESELFQLLRGAREIDLKGPAKVSVQAQSDALSERINRAVEGIDEEKREQGKCDVIELQAARDSERVAYLLENPPWWAQKNQRVLLELVFGPGTLRTRPGEGIIVHSDGTWDVKANTPILDDSKLRALAAKVETGLIRPRLLPKQRKLSPKPSPRR